jgi:hypothetical protein
LSAAYVDSSCLVAIALSEPNSIRVAEALEEHDELLSSNLLECELLSALAREAVYGEPPFLAEIGWLIPDRPLSHEIRRVLTHGRLRGADLWHLASALYLADDPRELHFLTLDIPQRDVAASIGFIAPVI